MNATRIALLLLAVCVPLVSCGPKRRAAPPTPPPTYSGPDFFRTTITSICSLRGYNPVLVSGFGLVVGLDATGSSDVPPRIARWLENQMSKGGFGQESLNMGHMTPDQVIMDDRTAVVMVEGLTPPGATRGSTFDVMVSAVPGTQTTSLEGGLLYTTDLSFGGANVGSPSSRPLARAYGPVFLNPFVEPDPMAPGGSGAANARVGRILDGGIAIEHANLALILHQPSYARARRVADRINGRFRKSQADKFPLAVAKDDKTVQLNVLRRFRHNPQRMLDLIGHLYMNPTEAFAAQQARTLLEELAKPDNHPYADHIAHAWEGMGKLILPILRDGYEHEDPVVRLAALSAGARLGDLAAAPPHLSRIATGDDGPAAERATAMLGVLLGHNPDHARLRAMLRNLLNSDDARVRMTAFGALFETGERAPYIIHRSYPGKFELALVRSDQPMIFVARHGAPRIVIFDQMLGFDYPLFASLWDNRLMIRGDEDEMTVAAYYRPPGTTHGQTHQIAPTVGNLVLLMANVPTDDDPTPGFNLGYSEVVKVLRRLTRSGAVDAPLVLQPSNLVERITSHRTGELGPTRPQRRETDNSTD